MCLDKGYDYDAVRDLLAEFGVFCPTPQKGIFQELAREIWCVPTSAEATMLRKILFHCEAVIAVHALSSVMTFKSDYAHSLAAMPRSSSPTALA
jgi:hypothetical protein